MTNANLFQEFPPVSKADWLRQITKDLKDKPLEDFVWQASEGLALSPFVHAEDFETPPVPLSEQPNAWEICEDVWVMDPVASNRQSMDALEGGAEALCFVLDRPLDATGFGQLLEGIHLDFIGLHFAGAAVSANPGMVFLHLEQLAQERGLDTKALRGSLAYDPVPVSSVVDWRYLADLIAYAREKFPQFKVIQVSTPAPISGEELSLPAQLAGAMRHANVYFQKLSERGIPVQDIAAFTQFSVPVGKNYFLEIAQLRAFKLLYSNVLKAWGAPLQAPELVAYFKPEAYSDDLYTNMIRATTMAMSAVQGGVARLTVAPYDTQREEQATYPPAFGRRIARNVQHLLKMESAMDAVADPAAGSYYLETLTQQLAEKAWAELGQ